METSCPECDYEGSQMGFASHWGKEHEGPRPIVVEHTEEAKAKISERSPGYTKSPSETEREQISESLTGRTLDESHRENIGDAFRGENHPRFRRNPDGPTTRVRRKVRYRDNYRCQNCMTPEHKFGETLHVHHKDEDRTNNALDNLIALCRSCHLGGEHAVY